METKEALWWVTEPEGFVYSGLLLTSHFSLQFGLP